MDHIARAHKQDSCKTASCCSNPLPNQHLVLQCSQEEHATCESIRERIISWLKTKAQIGGFQIVAFAWLPGFSYKDTCLTYTNITHCIYSWLNTFNTSFNEVILCQHLHSKSPFPYSNEKRGEALCLAVCRTTYCGPLGVFFGFWEVWQVCHKNHFQAASNGESRSCVLANMGRKSRKNKSQIVLSKRRITSLYVYVYIYIYRID